MYNGAEQGERTARLCCQVVRVEGRLVSGPNVRYIEYASAGPMAIASGSLKPIAFRMTMAPSLSNLISEICKSSSLPQTPFKGIPVHDAEPTWHRTFPKIDSYEMPHKVSTAWVPIEW